MTSSPAPNLHKNWLLAAVQPLSWLFFRPASWHTYCYTHFPMLTPLFPLSVLTYKHLRNPALRRLLWYTYGLWPMLLTTFTIIALRIAGTDIYQAIVIVIFGVCFGLIMGLILSAAAGVVAMTMAIILGALVWHSPEILLIDMILGTGYTWVYGITGAVTAHVTQNLGISADAGLRRSRSVMLRQFGGFVAALLVAVIATLLILIGVDQMVAARDTGSIVDGAVSILFAGIPASLLGLTSGWQATSLKASIRTTLFVFWIGIIIFGNAGMQPGLDIPARQLLKVMTLMTGLTYLTLFGVSFVLVSQLAGTWAGAIAGVAGGIALVPILNNLFQIYSFQANLLLALGLAIAGVTMHWWRPLLTYPLQAALHAVLLQRAEERQPLPLAFHPALWDELQFLPFYGFDDLLVELIDQKEMSITTLAEIGQGKQAWAAQAAQVELEARRFARCTTVSDIAAVGTITDNIEALGPSSTLLRVLLLIARDVHAATQQQSRYNQQLVLQSVADRLGTLLRELSRSNEFYAKRFLPITEHWQRLIDTEIVHLTGLSTHSGEIINPYVVGVPLTRKQEIFVGRTEITLQIEQLLRDQTHPPLLLYGQRRMGKTSLLYNLRWMLPHHILPLFVDLQGPVAWSADHAGLLYNIAKAMRTSASEQGVIFSSLERSALEKDPFSIFDDWLDAIQEQLHRADRDTILLTLDEFEALAQGFQIGHIREEAVLSTLRHIIQHRPKIKLLLAGAHELQEFPSWSSYLINAQTIHLDYLQSTEARHLIKQPVKNFSLTYTSDAIESILTLTRGHPYLLQLLCSEVVTRKNEQPIQLRYHATSEEITELLPAILKTGHQFFVDIERNQLAPHTATLLHILATQAEPFLIHQLPPLASIDTDAIDACIAVLSNRQLIESIHGGYQFQIPLIRMWFAQRAAPM